jgi:hypothetical protein
MNPTDEPAAPPPDPTPAAAALERAASFAAVGAGVVGFLRAAALVLAAGERGPTGPVAAAAVVTIVVALMVGWFAGVLLHGLAAIVRVLADQVEATARVDRRLATLGVAGPVAEPSRDLTLRDLAEIRQAIRAGAWDAAAARVATFADAHPGEPEAERLAADLAAAREAAARELLVKVEAAREVNDPERVIELRDALRPLIEAEALRTLDRDLAKWFLALIQRRLRAGTVRVDVAELAGRVAESFDDTPEGASLRASLPTLRRAAGLCARCAQPYVGIEKACPACLTGVVVPPSPTPPFEDPEANGPPAD